MEYEGKNERKYLTYDRGIGGSLYAHCGETAESVYQNGVENDVDDGAGALENHGLRGPAGGLEQPLAEDLDKNANGEDAADAGIGNAALNGLRHGGLHGEVGPGSEDAKEHE